MGNSILSCACFRGRGSALRLPISMRSTCLPAILVLSVPVAAVGFRPRPGDADGDRDVDLRDVAALQVCIGGSGQALPLGDECLTSFDVDLDGDVDLSDAYRVPCTANGPWPTWGESGCSTRKFGCLLLCGPYSGGCCLRNCSGKVIEAFDRVDAEYRCSPWGFVTHCSGLPVCSNCAICEFYYCLCQEYD